MFRSIHKLYSLFFYKLVRAIIKLDEVASKEFNFSMEWVMYRALLALGIINFIWVFVTYLILEIITGKVIPNYINDTTIEAVIFVAISTLFNYFVLIRKKRWFKYDEEFANYSKNKNRIIYTSISTFYISSFWVFWEVAKYSASLKRAGEIVDF